MVLDVVVRVPGLLRAVPHLHETHAALDQSPGDEHLPRLSAFAVHFTNGLGLAADVERVRGIHLHAIRELERFDPCAQPAIIRPALEIDLVEAAQRVELLSLALLAHAMILEVADRVLEVGNCY